MFPISITFNVTTAEQLAALTSVATGKAVTVAQSTKDVKADAVKKSEPATVAAVTAPAATQPTAAATVAQESKAETSAPAILDKDALTNAVKNAIVKAGREKVVELISSYGAAKAGDVALEKRVEFDAKLLALAA